MASNIIASLKYVFRYYNIEYSFSSVEDNYYYLIKGKNDIHLSMYVRPKNSFWHAHVDFYQFVMKEGVTFADTMTVIIKYLNA